MLRSQTLVIALSLLVGCEGRQKGMSDVGPQSAYAAERADSSAANTRRITERGDYWFGLSRDGTRAAMTDWPTGDILVRDLRTGTEERIIHNAEPYKDGFGMAPRISPDGKTLVVEWWDNQDNAELRLVPLDGSPARTLVIGKNHILPEDWSPDGRSVLAIHARDDGTNQIVLVSVDGDPERVLKTVDWREPMRMNFSPDGRYVVYDYPTVEGSNDHRDVFVFDLAKGSETRLVAHAANDYVLGWGPDNDHILFASDRTGTLGAWLQEVENGRPKGAPVLVKADIWAPTPGHFAADGSFVYGVSATNRRIFLASLDTSTGGVVGDPTPITPISSDRASDPQWSPDGRMISYLLTNQVATHTRIAIRDRESGETKEIPIPRTIGYAFHRWAPDGRSIILSASEKGRDGAFRLELRTRQFTTLYSLERGTATGSWLNVLPSGREVVYMKAVKGRPTAIVVRNLTTGTERVIHTSKLGAGVGPRIALSPDGERVAFMERTGPKGLLMVVPVGGGEARRVGNDSTSAGHPAWSADGRFVLVLRPSRDPENVGKAGLWRIPIDGGAPSGTGLMEEFVGAVRPDRSGRQMLFDAGQSKIELWTMEHIIPTRSAGARSR